MKSQLQELFLELKQDCKINKNALDDECCQQALLYTKWSGRLARAQENLKRVELELTQYKASKMVEEKQKKTSDKAAESIYRISSRYSELNKKITRLQRTVDIAQAGVYSMMQRKNMLEALVRLKTADYYS